MKLKDTGLTAQDIKDKVKKYMIETYERFDFIAETAEGMYLYDENGTPYLDFYAGIAVNNAGSRNPKVVAAVKDQVDDIMHTFNYPYTIPQALLAKKICDTIGMDKIFYQNSGTEANEAMIKMARKYDHEYKVQAVKLAKEIGGAKAAKELGIPEGTIHTWLKAVRAGTLDIGDGAHTPESAMSLAEELAMLRKRVKDQDKEIRRLKEENEFLEEASAFFAASRRKSARTKE